jgi:hypothetical protein
MKTVSPTSTSSTKGKIILLTIFLLSICSGLFATETFGADEPSSDAFNPVISYLILAGVFITGILIFTYFKHKEEKQQRKQRKNTRQVHFAARYTKHRLS